MAEQEVFEHGYAVVVGVNANQIPRLALPTVENDVTAVYDILIHPERCAYNPDNVKLLKGQDSTKNNILDALDWLKQQVDADPEATAVIYYSGHGWEDKEADKYYLIPYDIEDLGRIRRFAIPAEDFSDEVARIQAKRTLIMLDCCHAAGMKAKDIDLSAVEDIQSKSAAFPLDTLPKAKDIPVYDGVPGATSKAVSDLLEGEGRAILNSSTGSQSSWVPSGGKISIFTQHLIEALTGHAPHDDDDSTVLVTDVMSWVTRKVEKTAAANGVEQTPVMRTDGVFPIAQLIGGKGVALSKNVKPPDPLAPLPAAGNTTNYNFEGQTAEGDLYNVDNKGGNIGHIGPQNNINTGGGDYVGGNKTEGDYIGGDNITGNKYEGIHITGYQGSAISFGGGNQEVVINNPPATSQATNLVVLFAPLQQLVAQQAPALVGKVNVLKEEVGRGSGADDKVMAGLVQDLADGVSAVKPLLVQLFQNPEAAKTAGPRTEFVLERLA